MAYKVIITSSDGQKHTYKCGGASDQEALIYAGKVVEKKADQDDPDASVTITKDDNDIGPAVTVADMIQRIVRTH